MALIRYHYRIDPSTMTIEDFAKLWEEYKWCKNIENGNIK